MLQHVVLLKFRSEVTQAQVDSAFEQVADLKNRIPGITAFVHGPNNSTEGLSQGYTHGFVMTFADAASRDAYLPHPEHQLVVAANKPLLESILVVDFSC